MDSFLYAVGYLAAGIAAVALFIYLVELAVSRAEATTELREDETLLYTSSPGDYPIGSLWEGKMVTAVVPTESPALYRVLGRPSNANQGGAIL